MPRGNLCCPESADRLAILRELEEESASEGISRTLCRAYRSLVAHEYPVHTRFDFLKVRFVADIIATWVDKRLRDRRVLQSTCMTTAPGNETDPHTRRQRKEHARQASDQYGRQQQRCINVLPGTDEELIEETRAAANMYRCRDRRGTQGAGSQERYQPRTPRYRTCRFAILIALLKAEYETPPRLMLHEDKIMSLAQQYADKPLSAKKTANVDVLYEGISVLRGNS